MPYVGRLHLCLFNHASYLLPHHHNWLEKNRHELKCCDVIYFAFSLNSCLFIPGVFFYFWSEVFTIINCKMHTFDLLIVKGDTLR